MKRHMQELQSYLRHGPWHSYADEDEIQEETSAEAAHYWQACADVDSLGQLAAAAEARTPHPSNVEASSDTANEQSPSEYPGHISQGVWVGRHEPFPDPAPSTYILCIFELPPCH